MTQAERDWLVALKKAKKRLITQKEAALELGVTERHVQRIVEVAEEARRQSGNPCVAGTEIESADRGGDSTEGDENLIAGGVSRIRTDAGERIPG